MGIYYGLMEEIQKLATWLDDVGELDRMVQKAQGKDKKENQKPIAESPVSNLQREGK